MPEVKKSAKKSSDSDSDVEFEILEIEESDEDSDISASNSVPEKRKTRSQSSSTPKKKWKVSHTKKGNKKYDSPKTQPESGPNKSPKSDSLSVNTSREIEYGQKPSFTPGAFVVLKTDFNSDASPVLWKIDGKALLRKYVPSNEDGQLVYKDTNTYAGWTIDNKVLYYSAPVTYLKRTTEAHYVKFDKDQVITNEEETASIGIENITLEPFENMNAVVISGEKLEDSTVSSNNSPPKHNLRPQRKATTRITSVTPPASTEPHQRPKVESLLQELQDELKNASNEELKLLKIMLSNVKYGYEAFKSSKIKLRERSAKPGRRSQNQWKDFAIKCFINGEELMNK